MKNRSALIAIGLIILLLRAALADGSADRHRYLSTTAELESLIGAWLKQYGYTVQRTILPMGRIKLAAYRRDIHWNIVLEPDSPLATEVCVAPDTASAPAGDQLTRLHDYITTYLANPPEEETHLSSAVPQKVAVHGHAVVCIQTHRRENNIQSSGLVIEKHGLILTTAHDLNPGEKIILTPPTGPLQTGRVLAIDHTLDLALITSDAQYDQAISIADGRNLLDMGEQVYSLGCPGSQGIEAAAGVINGPPRRANGQPLWQVNMKVVPGSSGRPVFDSRGTFVALVKGRYRGVANVGFLIPLETIIHFLRISLS